MGKFNADVNKSAPEILDPQSPVQEAPQKNVALDRDIGDSYPTDEAVAAELKAKQKPVSDEMMKKSGTSSTEVRSAIDPLHTSVVHPGAVPESATAVRKTTDDDKTAAVKKDQENAAKNGQIEKK